VDGATAKLIDKYLREEIARLLHGRGIYDPNSYGWSGPDDYDSETIGHAMAQTDSLSFRYLDAHLYATHANGPPPRVLAPWEQFLVQSGEDFEGLMHAAWLSVGLTLFHNQTTDREHYAENSLFQVQLISSTVILSTAADRLRDFFVAAVFQERTAQYENARAEEDRKKGRDDRTAVWYSGPFYEAAQSAVAGIHARSAFELLPDMSDRMFVFRSVRNQVVHSVATELGRQARELAKQTAPDRVEESISFDDVRRWQEQAETEYRQRVEADATRLIDWYKLLIEMSNQIFIVENTLRRNRQD
jgi:hypothetical protein